MAPHKPADGDAQKKGKASKSVADFFPVDKTHQVNQQRDRRQKERTKKKATTNNNADKRLRTKKDRKRKRDGDNNESHARKKALVEKANKERAAIVAVAGSSSSKVGKVKSEIDPVKMAEAVAEWDRVKHQEKPPTKGDIARKHEFEPNTFRKYVCDDISKRRKIGAKPGKIVTDENAQFAGMSDKFLISEGCAKGSTIAMTPNAFMTEEAWKEISLKVCVCDSHAVFIQFHTSMLLPHYPLDC